MEQYKTRKVFWFAILASLVAVVSLTFMSFQLGRFKGFHEGFNMALQNQAPVSSQNVQPSGARETGKTKPSKSLQTQPGTSSLAGLQKLAKPPVSSGKSEETEVTEQLGKLEGLMNQFVPADSVPSLEPSKEVLDQIVMAKSDGDKAVKDYLDKIEKTLASSVEVSPQALAGGGNSAALKQSLDDLDGAHKEMKGMAVPKRCKDLHAQYLILIPELKTLFSMQQKAKTEGDISTIMESMVLARTVLARQRKIQDLETGLKQTLKG